MATSRKSRRKPQVGQITDALPIPPSSILRLPSLLQPPPQFQPFPFLLLFPLPLNVSLGRSALSSPYCPAKTTTGRKSWRGPNTTGPHDFLSGERVPRAPYGGCAYDPNRERYSIEIGLVSRLEFRSRSRGQTFRLGLNASISDTTSIRSPECRSQSVSRPK